jgi:cytidylate kinase
MTDDLIPVITIDGPAGSGKGTIAKQLAASLSYHYLDSGALYRILGLLSQQRDIGVDDVDSLVNLCGAMEVRFGFDAQNMRNKGQEQLQEHVPVFLNDAEVSMDLRTEECAAQASKLAALLEVRVALLQKQRSFQQLPGLVAEGRDMGTTVFPSAEYKFFLTASAEARASRRQKQLKKQGISASLVTLLKEIETRDFRDQNRKVSPLRPATDAVLVDSTNLSIEQVVNQLTDLVHGGH